jgi:hypothetical protein
MRRGRRIVGFGQVDQEQREEGLVPDVQGRKGTVGLITQNATAEFDDFLAYQP